MCYTCVHITELHNAVSLPRYITVDSVGWCVGGYININSEGGKNCHNVTFINVWKRRVCDQKKNSETKISLIILLYCHEVQLCKVKQVLLKLIINNELVSVLSVSLRRLRYIVILQVILKLI